VRGQAGHVRTTFATKNLSQQSRSQYSEYTSVTFNDAINKFAFTSHINTFTIISLESVTVLSSVLNKSENE